MRLVKYRGYWYVYANGKRASLFTADRVLAEQKFEDFKKTLKRKKENLGEIVASYLEEKKNKPSIGGMGDAWKAAKQTFGNLRPDQISRELCRSYIEKRRDSGVTNGTIRKELGVLRQAIRWSDPQAAPQIELPPTSPPKEKYLTKAEYKKLLEACSTPHLKLFVQLALLTAGRKGAILDLTWDQVDFEKDLIKLSKGSKTNKGRATVPMNETLKTALLARKKDIKSDYVLSIAGEKIKSVNKGFREACKRAGLEGVTPHDMRRTAATWMAQSGVPLHEIAKFLGHTNLKMVYTHYAKFSPDYLRTAAKALEVD